jgi:hypothetical protein
MKRVWSGSPLHDTAHLQNLLEQAGIGCFIKNRDLGGALGDLPFLDCSPELWVLRDEQAERATAVLRDALRPLPRAQGAAWRCGRCGEDNEAQFGACWSCGNAETAALE